MDRESSLGGCFVLQLHGNLAPELQDLAIRKGSSGRGGRRVILSTPIAESSVTIDGVRVVVDSGLRRSPAYDIQTGKCGSASSAPPTALAHHALSRETCWDSDDLKDGRVSHSSPRQQLLLSLIHISEPTRPY